MKKSFTLIEPLIAISVTLIFLGVSLVQYNNYTEQVRLKNDGKKLLDVIELAKKKALFSDLQDKNCSNFTGYRLTLNTNNYSLIFCCNSICLTNTNTYNFNTNISIFSGSGNLDFPPLMKGSNITINSVQLKNSAINKCLNISISAIGIVELDETLIGC